MRILVSGSSGLIGSALVPLLEDEGHAVTRLVRAEAGDGCVQWNPAAGKIDAAGIEGHDAAVHLAGENIAGRWTAQRKARIRDSRVDGTRLLAETLAGLEAPPKALLAASAMGYYGNRGDEVLTEDSPAGEGFLPDLCRAWEAAAEPAAAAGIRVVHLRFGVVLSPAGGALAKMLPIFRLGLGGRAGSGRQYMSWIALDDAVRAVGFLLDREAVSGAVNVVTQDHVRNREFAKTLGRVLRRPALLPAPAFALRLAFGEMAEATVLASTRVEPAKLYQAGFDFEYPDLEVALRHLLGRGEPDQSV